MGQKLWPSFLDEKERLNGASSFYTEGNFQQRKKGMIDQMIDYNYCSVSTVHELYKYIYI